MRDSGLLIRGRWTSTTDATRVRLSYAKHRKAQVFQRVSVAILGLGLVLGNPAPVRAEPTAEKREAARKLAAEGFEALERRNYPVAEDRFRRADALVHAPTLVVDHARALAGLGRLVEAHERYELVLREGLAPNAPWQWRMALADATRELQALKPRLAWLTLRVKGPVEPNVLVDNKVVPVAALGVRRATDPGTHSVTVSAPGFAPKEEMVSLDEGQVLAVEIELDPVSGSAKLPSSRPRQQRRPTELPPLVGSDESSSAAPDNTLAYVLLGFGALGIAAGSVTGGLALGARSDLATHCADGVCVPKTPRELAEHRNDIDQYHLWGTLSGIGFAVGAGAAAAGVTILLLREDSESKSPSKVEASIGVGSVQLRAGF